MTQRAKKVDGCCSGTWVLSSTHWPEKATKGTWRSFGAAEAQGLGSEVEHVEILEVQGTPC